MPDFWEELTRQQMMTTPGIGKPFTDPVIQAFMAGYNLPAPSEKKAEAVPTLEDWQKYMRGVGGYLAKQWGQPPATEKYAPKYDTERQKLEASKVIGEMYPMLPEAHLYQYSPEAMQRYELTRWIEQKQPQLSTILKGAIDSWASVNVSKAIIEEPTDPNTGKPLIETAEQETSFYDRYAYGKAYFDENGNQLSDEDMRALYETNPSAKITRVYDIGGGETVSDTKSVRDYLGVSGTWEAHMAETGAIAQKTKEARSAFDTQRSEILKDVSAENVMEKAAQLWDMAGRVGGEPTYGTDEQGRIVTQTQGASPYKSWADALNDAEKSLSPEEFKKLGDEATREAIRKGLQDEWKAWQKETGADKTFEEWLPHRGSKEKWWEAKTDIKTLRKTLETYGISILDNYPYLSPMSRAQILRVPSNVLEQMSNYLKEKGISWSDFVAIGESYFGGGGGYGGRWAVAQQWG